MSCSSTRTSHNICVPGCPEENGVALCPCPATAAFACRPLCPCPELEDNVFLSQGRLANEICFDVRAVVPAVDGTSANFRALLTGASFFSATCSVAIEVALSPAVVPRVFLGVGLVQNGTFDSDLVAIPAGTYDLFVGGKLCGNPITFI